MPETVKVYVDASCTENPNRRGIGICVRADDLESDSSFFAIPKSSIGINKIFTNSFEIEYLACLFGIIAAKQYTPNTIHVFNDNNQVIEYLRDHKFEFRMLSGTRIEFHHDNLSDEIKKAHQLSRSDISVDHKKPLTHKIDLSQLLED